MRNSRAFLIIGVALLHITIGKGRTIVKHEAGCAGTRFANALVQPHLLPFV